MDITFDTLQVIAWSITYFLIIIYNVKYRKLGIPPIALASNFAWETIAIYWDYSIDHFVNIFHIVWFILDLAIVITYIGRCEPAYLRKKYYWFGILLIDLIIFYHIFQLSFGMLISSFIIDTTMAIEYFIFCKAKKIIPNILSISFCITKLLGDLFALVYYAHLSIIVLVLGIVVLIANSACLQYLIIIQYKCKKQSNDL